MPLYSIGHSNHQIEKFFELLAHHSITKLIDVRSVPYSGHNPHFNREPLSEACSARDVEYIYRGNSLGGFSNDKSDIDAENFRASIHEIASKFGNADENVALMCSERDPVMCHRSTLIGVTLRGLEKNPVDLIHILHDSNVVSQSDLELSGKVKGADRSGTLPLFG